MIVEFGIMMIVLGATSHLFSTVKKTFTERRDERMKNDNGGIEPIGGKQGGMEPTSDLAGGPSAMREAGIEDDKRMLQSRDKGSKAMDAADGLRRASSGDRVFDSIMRGATLYGVTRVGIAMTNGVIRGATKLVSWLRKIEREYQDEDLNAR